MSAVSFKSAAVTGFGCATVATVGQQVGSVTSAFTAVGVAVSSLVSSNGPATGAASVTLLGGNAGLAAWSSVAFFYTLLRAHDT